MSNFFAPKQQGQQGQEGQDQSNFITKDEFYSYVRSDSFRSVMKNQNSDLYKFGEWVSYPQAGLFISNTYPYTTSYPVELGTDPTKFASYTQIGNTVVYKFYFKFGSSIPASSSGGNYLVDLPVQPQTATGYRPAASSTYPEAQEFCGHAFAYGGGTHFSTKGPVVSLLASVLIDYSTGTALSPGKIMFTYLSPNISNYYGGNIYGGQHYFSEGNYDPVNNYMPYPIQGSILSGQVTYQSDIIKGN